jgi:hypothetical protein
MKYCPNAASVGRLYQGWTLVTSVDIMTTPRHFGFGSGQRICGGFLVQIEQLEGILQ